MKHSLSLRYYPTHLIYTTTILLYNCYKSSCVNYFPQVTQLVSWEIEIRMKEFLMLKLVSSFRISKYLTENLYLKLVSE